MARNGKEAYDLQEIWSMRMAPFMIAARQGANHAMRTAQRERMRARMRTRMMRSRQRRRWLMTAAGAGLAMIGIAGVLSAARARRQIDDQHLRHGEHPRHGEYAPTGATGQAATGSQPPPMSEHSSTHAGHRGRAQ